MFHYIHPRLIAGVALPFAGAAREGLPVASYQADLDAFQAERAAAGGPGFSAADRTVMEQAGADLARSLPDPGLRSGELAPDFTLPNAKGERVRLSQRLARGPVVLSFYRGAWCPYCNLQLRGLQRSLPAFECLGAQLIAVTPQRPDRSLAQIDADGYKFEILSDRDSRVMRAYRLYFEVPPALSALYQRNLGLDLAEYNGPDRYLLPVPGTYVLDSQGRVRAAFADTDYTRRMEPADILAALKQLAGEAL
jgi:peroxiredoxin